MPRPNPYRPFTPDPAQMACAPSISGNAINGLGETDVRRPSTVYWATDPATIPHGAMQRWFFTVDPGHPEFGRQRTLRREIIDAPLPPLAPDAAERAPEAWTEALDRFVAGGTCDKVGVAALDPSWVFEGYDVAWKTVIVAGVQHDYDEIAHAPKPAAGAEVMRQYTRAAGAAKDIAGWLRTEGWDAEPVTGPMAGALAMIPAAIEAGLGELGKHGSIINPEFGASFRLSAVMTDAPFAATPKQDHGIDAFCAACRVCEDACPPEALFPEKKTVRGTKKGVRRFRPLPAVLQSDAGLCDLHRRLPVEPARRRRESGSEAGATGRSAERRGGRTELSGCAATVSIPVRGASPSRSPGYFPTED